MSRVSDAIRRAAEEGGRSVQEPAEQWIAPIPENGNFNLKVETHLSDTKEIGQNKRSTSRNHVEAIKSANSTKRPNGQLEASVLDKSGSISRRSILRNWIEQILYGRDMRKIEPYPLTALEKNSHAGEQYKMLREQINKIIGEGARQFIAVTSPIKGDGKTTVAANLAAAMALHRERGVLLVDADLRSPSIHRYFSVSSSPGLADYLGSAEAGELMDYVQDTSIPGLRLLTAGKATSYSAELLASERMKTLVEEISAKFSSDQVIVDTSPVLSTSDPLVLSRQLDGLLMVVRAGKTPRDCLSEAIKLVGVDKIMGLVLNGAELGRSARCYYYYGQQS